MGGVIDVLVASLTDKLPRGLRHIPGEWTTFRNDAPGWAAAANQLLDGSTNDVLLMDDDITLTPHTFKRFEKVRSHADIIGFTLVTPENKVQSAGWSLKILGPADPLDKDHVGLVWPSQLEEVQEPAYVAHVSASCMFIKRAVVESGLRFPEWPGLLYEDVRFTVEAWLKGFKVAYCPGVVFHDHSATKNRAAGKEALIQENYDLLVQWLREIDIENRLKEGQVPIGRQPIPQVSVPQDTAVLRPA